MSFIPIKVGALGNGVRVFLMLPLLRSLDATPLGQEPLCVLPVVYKLWASVGLQQMSERCEGWLLESAFSAARYVDGWYSNCLHIEETLASRRWPADGLLVFVADVTQSFATVDRGVLD